MKSKIIFLSLFAAVLIFSGIQGVSAHELETSSSIGAVLHVDPNDDPIVGQPAKLNFEFKDQENKLDITKCDCDVYIEQGDMEIFRKKITENNVAFTKDTLSVPYVFPAVGIYDIHVEGKPMDGHLFSSFLIHYDFEVRKEAPINTENVSTTTSPSSITKFLGGHVLHIIFFGAAILISIYIIVTDKGGKKKVNE